MRKRVDGWSESPEARGRRGNGGYASDRCAIDGTSFLLVLSRIASLGGLVLIAVAIGRLLLTPPAGIADAIPSLLLLVAAAHLALLGIVSWLLVEPVGEVRRSNADGEGGGDGEEDENGDGGTGAGAVEVTSRATVRGSESGPAASGSRRVRESKRVA